MTKSTVTTLLSFVFPHPPNINTNIIFVFKVRVAQTACMSACQHVAKSLMVMLLSEDVKQMSLAALEQVNLDVIQCERNYSLQFLVVVLHF